MRIEVKAEHIAAGTQGDGASCPIALAVLDVVRPLYGSNLHADVDPCNFVPGSSLIFVNDGDPYGIDYVLDVMEGSDNVADFVRDFDNGRPVEPFTFEVDMGPREEMNEDLCDCAECKADRAEDDDAGN